MASMLHSSLLPPSRELLLSSCPSSPAHRANKINHYQECKPLAASAELAGKHDVAGVVNGSGDRELIPYTTTSSASSKRASLSSASHRRSLSADDNDFFKLASALINQSSDDSSISSTTTCITTAVMTTDRVLVKHRRDSLRTRAWRFQLSAEARLHDSGSWLKTIMADEMDMLRANKSKSVTAVDTASASQEVKPNDDDNEGNNDSEDVSVSEVSSSSLTTSPSSSPRHSISITGEEQRRQHLAALWKTTFSKWAALKVHRTIHCRMAVNLFPIVEWDSEELDENASWRHMCLNYNVRIGVNEILGQRYPKRDSPKLTSASDSNTLKRSPVVQYLSSTFVSTMTRGWMMGVPNRLGWHTRALVKINWFTLTLIVGQRSTHSLDQLQYIDSCINDTWIELLIDHQRVRLNCIKESECEQFVHQLRLMLGWLRTQAVSSQSSGLLRDFNATQWLARVQRSEGIPVLKHRSRGGQHLRYVRINMRTHTIEWAKDRDFKQRKSLHLVSDITSVTKGKRPSMSSMSASHQLAALGGDYGFELVSRERSVYFICIGATPQEEAEHWQAGLRCLIVCIKEEIMKEKLTRRFSNTAVQESPTISYSYSNTANCKSSDKHNPQSASIQPMLFVKGSLAQQRKQQQDKRCSFEGLREIKYSDTLDESETKGWDEPVVTRPRSATIKEDRDPRAPRLLRVHPGRRLGD